MLAWCVPGRPSLGQGHDNQIRGSADALMNVLWPWKRGRWEEILSRGTGGAALVFWVDTEGGGERSRAGGSGVVWDSAVVSRLNPPHISWREHSSTPAEPV